MSEILSSWKEIAEFLGKGVRTAQRWERELGLPVRRPPCKDSRVVFALREELTAWVKAQPYAGLNSSVLTPPLTLVPAQKLNPATDLSKTVTRRAS